MQDQRLGANQADYKHLQDYCEKHASQYIHIQHKQSQHGQQQIQLENLFKRALQGCSQFGRFREKHSDQARGRFVVQEARARGGRLRNLRQGVQKPRCEPAPHALHRYQEGDTLRPQRRQMGERRDERVVREGDRHHIEQKFHGDSTMERSQSGLRHGRGEKTRIYVDHETLDGRVFRQRGGRKRAKNHPQFFQEHASRQRFFEFGLEITRDNKVANENNYRRERGSPLRNVRESREQRTGKLCFREACPPAGRHFVYERRRERYVFMHREKDLFGFVGEY